MLRCIYGAEVPNYDEVPVHPSDVNGRGSRELGDVASKAISPSIEGRFSTLAEFGVALR